MSDANDRNQERIIHDDNDNVSSDVARAIVDSTTAKQPKRSLYDTLVDTLNDKNKGYEMDEAEEVGKPVASNRSYEFTKEELEEIKELVVLNEFFQLLNGEIERLEIEKQGLMEKNKNFTGLRGAAAYKLKQLHTEKQEILPGGAESRYEFTEAELEEINTYHELEHFIQQLNGEIKRMDMEISGCSTKKEQLARLQGSTEDKQKDFSSQKDAFKEVSRVAEIDYQIESEKFHGSFDLKRLKERVDNLFKWHEVEGEKPYLAPYFPVIQSSGMGKTKLLHEFRAKNTADITVKLLLCVTSGGMETKPNMYDGVVTAPMGSTKEDRIFFTEQLKTFMPEVDCGKYKSKVLLVFDEAQNLTDPTKNAFAFRCLRWWLRSTSLNSHKFAAVLLGTTSALANFYVEHPANNLSRDGTDYYKAKNVLYQPFYDLSTIQCIPYSKEQLSDLASKSEYERAIRYGRPLFSLAYRQGDLDLKKHPEKYNTILNRMLLSNGPSDWQKKLEACLSILSSRVQMGQTSSAIVSNLVGKGYSCLTQFTLHTKDEGSIPETFAKFCCFTDPVCSRLAMCLMDTDWKLIINDSISYQGEEPTFWTRNAIELFGNGMCHPNKGDLGEVAAAMYLLFCGDKIRKIQNTNYTQFSVPFLLWLDVLKNPEKVVTTSDLQNSVTEKQHVSMIQFRKLYFRLNWDQLSKHKFLKHLYESGTACYLYDYCPMFDFVASIKCDEDSYKPLLVSVKARKKYSDADITLFHDECKNSHNDRECLLVLIGLDTPISEEEVPQGTTMLTRSKEENTSDGDAVPKKRSRTRRRSRAKNTSDGDSVLKESSRMITRSKTENTSDGDAVLKKGYVVKVPNQDPFGVSDLVLSSTVDHVKAQIYASHPELSSFSDKNGDSFEILAKEFLLKNEPEEANLKYLDEMRQDFQR